MRWTRYDHYKSVWDKLLSIVGYNRFSERIITDARYEISRTPLPETAMLDFSSILEELPDTRRFHVTLERGPKARENSRVLSATELIQQLPALQETHNR